MKKIILFTIILLTISCSKNNDENSIQNYPITITPTLIGKGDLYGAGSENIQQQNVIITNQNDWNLLISKMNTSNNVSNGFSQTNIDFLNYEIIAIYDSLKGNGGHSIEITNIEENQNTIIITIDRLHNGDDTSVITQPYHIVKIAKTTKTIIFQ
jgi:hypothetical protein